MELGSSEPGQYIKTLDMDKFTCFDTEEEHLIFETRLHIKNIFIQSSKQWIGSKLMKRFSLYDLLIHGHNINDPSLLKPKNQSGLLGMLQYVMNKDIATYTTSNYVNNLLKTVIEENNKIWLNKNQITSLTNKQLEKMFIRNDGKQLGEYISYLKTNYGAVICPTFNIPWKMDSQALKQITTSNNDKIKNVQLLYAGPRITCPMSNELFLVFQPQLRRVGSLLDLEMKLVPTVENLSVEAHFDIEYGSYTKYFKSLRQIMDVKWNNSFHVELPLDIEDDTDSKEHQTASSVLTVSVMIQSAYGEEAVEIDYEQEVNTTELVVDATVQEKQYTFPSLLSIFYGVSNSIICILDNISDLLFVIWVLYLSDLDTLFAVLAFGDLLSVYLIITMYTTYKMTVGHFQTFLFQIIFFLCLLVFAPFLPVFEWASQRMKKSLVIALPIAGTDGILDWFQNELGKNEMFFVQAIVQSCFQIILQFVAVLTIATTFVEYNIYIYLSVVISMAVIMSKFILISYNNKRAQ
eukprot:399711_1